MDGSRFDALTQRLTAIRLTRGNALRGLAAGALTLTGMVKVADEASAGKKPYCDCPDATAECTDVRASKKARKRYLGEHPCSYTGTCRGPGDHNPCKNAGVALDVDVDRLEISCTPGGGECGDQNTTGLECYFALSGIDFGHCEPSDCIFGGELNVCGTGNDALCCVVGAGCFSPGLCVIARDPL
jgi:hypothetical protein